MVSDDSPTPLPEAPQLEFDLGTTIERMACRLVQIQRQKIEALECELRTAKRCNEQLAGELLEASEARATALCSLQHAVAKMRHTTETVVKQRDVVLDALRAVVGVCWTTAEGVLSIPDVPAWVKAHHQAAELLKVVDQLQAAAKDRPPAG